eukprot:15816453-Heterocapsa_arctica.AAC.1
MHDYIILSGGPTGVHAQVYMTRAVCTSKYGHRTKTMLERVFEADNWSQAQIVFAKCSACCEEPNGDSEDARRPFNNL